MISCVLFALGIIILVVLRVSSLLNEFVLFALQLKGGEDFADWISRCMSLEPQDVILFEISSSSFFLFCLWQIHFLGLSRE